MSQCAFDVTGYIGDVASARGWHEMANVMRRSRDPELVFFANEGYSEKLDRLVLSLKRLCKSGLPDGLQAVCRNLNQLAKKANGILIVSDCIADESSNSVRPRVSLRKKEPAAASVRNQAKSRKSSRRN